MKLRKLVKVCKAKLRANAPEILLFFGISAGVAGTVKACVDSTKVKELINESKNEIESICERGENGEDVKGELRKAKINAGFKIVRLYSVSAGLGAVSVTSILSSHKIIKKRNVLLAGSLAAINKNFNGYRGRVKERFGDRTDYELMYDIKEQEISETVVNSNGKEKTTTKKVDVVNTDLNDYSPYARFFDETADAWERDSEYNLMLLHEVQDYFTNILRIDKHLFLNDVYRRLGMRICKEGQEVGWIYDPDASDSDNKVDFGIYKIYKQNRAFVNGYEPSILLDFNIDGYILDRI